MKNSGGLLSAAIVGDNSTVTQHLHFHGKRKRERPKADVCVLVSTLNDQETFSRSFPVALRNSGESQNVLQLVMTKRVGLLKLGETLNKYAVLLFPSSKLFERPETVCDTVVEIRQTMATWIEEEPCVIYCRDKPAELTNEEAGGVCWLISPASNQYILEAAHGDKRFKEISSDGDPYVRHLRRDTDGILYSARQDDGTALRDLLGKLLDAPTSNITMEPLFFLKLKNMGRDDFSIEWLFNFARGLKEHPFARLFQLAKRISGGHGSTIVILELENDDTLRPLLCSFMAALNFADKLEEDDRFTLFAGFKAERSNQAEFNRYARENDYLEKQKSGTWIRKNSEMKTPEESSSVVAAEGSSKRKRLNVEEEFCEPEMTPVRQGKRRASVATPLVNPRPVIEHQISAPAMLEHIPAPKGKRGRDQSSSEKSKKI